MRRDSIWQKVLFIGSFLSIFWLIACLSMYGAWKLWELHISKLIG